jgi:hypothetical protein
MLTQSVLFWVEKFFSEVNFADAAIATFTGLLWWSTRSLWRETSSSLDAIKKSEMAHVLVKGVTLRLEKHKAGNLYLPKFNVDFWNYGKTPGFIHRTTIYFTMSPKRTNDDGRIDIDSLVPRARSGTYDNGFSLPPNSSQPATDQYGTEPIPAGEMDEMMKAGTDQQLFVWGEVVFSPVFDEKWISGFAYRISLVAARDPTTGRMDLFVQKNVSEGGAKYWRYKRVAEQ